MTELIDKAIPSQLFRVGRFVIFTTCLVLLIVGWMFSYPDVIEAKVIITSSPEPVNVHSEITGYIDTFYIKDGDYVYENEPLVRMKSIVNYNDIVRIKSFISSFNNTQFDVSYLKLDFPNMGYLGELSMSYSLLHDTYSDLLFELKDGSVFKRINSLKQEIKSVKNNNRILESEVLLIEKEQDIVSYNLERNKELYNSGSVSKVDIEKIEIQHIQRERQISQIERSISDNEITILKMNNSIRELSDKRFLLVRKYVHEVRKSIVAFQQDLHNWEKRNIVLSPFSGTTTITILNQKRPYITSSDVICTLLPDAPFNENDIYAQCFISPMSIGKLKYPARTSIRLDAYPYQEFGSIECSIKKISNIPINHYKDEPPLYLARIQLAEPILTNYNDTIPFTNKMTGMARIIAKERNIFNRLFDKILSELRKD